MQFEQITVSGTPYRMGVSFGEQCGEKIRACLIDVIGEKPPELMLKKAESFFPVYERYFPQGLEEIRGTADGAGISLREALLLQVRWELSTVPDGECTSFSVTAPATLDGKPYAGMNKDVSEWSRENMFVLRMIPDDRPRKLIVAYYGSMGGPGMNEWGVSFFGNSLMGGVPRFSIPQPVLMRLLLEQRDVEGCIDVIRSLEEDGIIGFSGNFTVSDRKGGMACVEVMSDLYDILRPPLNKGYEVHANHVLSKNPAMRAHETKAFTGNTYGRQARFEALLENAYGRIDVDILKDTLRDHDGAPHAICRHGAKIVDQVSVTAMSMIAMPYACAAWIAKGAPCENDYVRYEV